MDDPAGRYDGRAIRETAGDFLAQTLNHGYVVGFAITVTLLVIVLLAQVRSDRYHPALFWTGIVATTTAGTEISDMMDPTFSAGDVLGSMILFAGLLATLAIWYAPRRTLSVDPIADKGSEILLWLAVTFSNSLVNAFGDALIDPVGLTYVQGAFVCSAVIAVVLHYFAKVNAVLLFWTAFIFTRPFGATFGNFLTKEHAKGGLELGTLQTSLVATVLLGIVMFCSIRFERGQRTLSSAA